MTFLLSDGMLSDNINLSNKMLYKLCMLSDTILPENNGIWYFHKKWIIMLSNNMIYDNLMLSDDMLHEFFLFLNTSQTDIKMFIKNLLE
jgi:hypothetical protein